jgi:hypothetical protein
MVEDVIGQSRLTDGQKDPAGSPPDIQPSEESLLSVEKIAKAVGKKFSANNDISRFSITVENLSEGYKTFAILNGPQEPAVMG